MNAGKQSGAALLTVLVAMMIMTIMLFEFQYSSTIERRLAYNELNQLQAYYLAKAGIRVGLLRLTLYGRAKKSPELKKMMQGADISKFLEPIWSLPVPSFPPKESNLAQMEKKDKDAAETVLEQTRIVDGEYTHVITSEGGKINLNDLRVPASQLDTIPNCDNPGGGLHIYLCRALRSLLENFLKDSEDPYQEYGNLKPEELIFDIMDWVNPGSNRLMGGSKDAFYEQQNPPYRAKRNRFYTLEELKLVRGIDDNLFNKLRPYVTVYSYDGNINLNEARADVYRALYPDFTEDDIKRILEERTRVNGWADANQFVSFVTGTLGRSGFTSYFPQQAEYPFGTGNPSFVIESMGILRKSKSEVRRVIRVGVALSVARAKGGVTALPFNDKASCEAAGKWWRILISQATDGLCYEKPTTKEACDSQPGGKWFVRAGQNCCEVNNTPPLCTAANQTQAPVEPNSLKILSWSEI